MPTPESTARHQTRARLSAAVLVYYVGIILLITLVPFRFMEQERFRVLWTGGVVDILANVAFFVPVGFLYPLSRRGTILRRLVGAVGFGALLSSAIELAQLFEPERFTSVVDLAANTSGAAIGAAIFVLVARRLDEKGGLSGRLSLELPLMGVLYLLLPLMWLSAIAIGDEPARWLLPALLCLFGGRLWAVLHHFHFSPLAGVSRWQMRLVAGSWALLGLAPAAGDPLTVLLLSLLTAACVRQIPATVHWGERRFEMAALTYALPLFLGYLVALALLPALGGIGPWQGFAGFVSSTRALSTVGQLRALEAIAAASVLGYLLAEVAGRRELRYREIAPRLAMLSAVFAAAVEMVRGVQPGLGASAAEFLLVTLAGLYGGRIYHLQRHHIRGRPAAQSTIDHPEQGDGDQQPASDHRHLDERLTA